MLISTLRGLYIVLHKRANETAESNICRVLGHTNCRIYQLSGYFSVLRNTNYAKDDAESRYRKMDNLKQRWEVTI
ncbi:hypothetical protein ACLKA7_002233 [Drosophila subpalustris]